MNEKQKPNILFINTDQQRADTLGCYGNEIIKTPNLDKLAAEGVSFQNMHCTHPLCSPARASWVTGEYIHSHGLWRNGTKLDQKKDNVIKSLKNNGYSTGLIGKLHLTNYLGDPMHNPESIRTNNQNYPMSEKLVMDYWKFFKPPYFGYDYVNMTLGHGDYGMTGGHYGLWINENHKDKLPLFYRDKALDGKNSYDTWKSAVPIEIHSSTWITDRADEFLSENTDKPFVLSVGFQEPHPPFCPPKPYCDMYNPDDIPLPVRREGEWGEKPPCHVDYYHKRGKGDEITEQREREMLAAYYGFVTLIDDSVGRLLASLEKYGLSDNTIVIFTSDHGDWMGDHSLHFKGAVHMRGVTRIPMIVKWPNVAKKGLKIDHVASQIDIAATMYDIAGVKPHYTNQGESLREAISGDTSHMRDYALIEHCHEKYDEDGYYVNNHFEDVPAEQRKAAAQSNLINHTDKDIHMKTIVTDDYRFSYVPEYNYGELFDHKNDIDELYNLYGKDTDMEREATKELLKALGECTPKCQERLWEV